MQRKIFQVVRKFGYSKANSLCSFSTDIELVLKNYSNELAQSGIM